jgi:hypothetical protein
LPSKSLPGFFCQEKTASATQPQPCPIGTFNDGEAAAARLDCKECPNADDCTSAGKSAPDCIPSAWRPSTFSCYDIRDQIWIIAGAVFTGVGSLFTASTFYSRYTQGCLRVGKLSVDLTHFAPTVRVVIIAVFIDKVVELHKRKTPITFKSLVTALPFDENMDMDVEQLIDERVSQRVAEIKKSLDDLLDSRIQKIISELEKRDQVLDSNELADIFRASAHGPQALVAKAVSALTQRRHAAHLASNQRIPVASKQTSRLGPLPPNSVVASQVSSNIGAASSTSAALVSAATQQTKGSAPLNTAAALLRTDDDDASVAQNLRAEPSSVRLQRQVLESWPSDAARSASPNLTSHATHRDQSVSAAVQSSHTNAASAVSCASDAPVAQEPAANTGKTLVPSLLPEPRRALRSMVLEIAADRRSAPRSRSKSRSSAAAPPSTQNLSS